MHCGWKILIVPVHVLVFYLYKRAWRPLQWHVTWFNNCEFYMFTSNKQMLNKLSSVISGCISCKLQQKVTWGGWISGPSMFEIIKKLNQMVMVRLHVHLLKVKPPGGSSIVISLSNIFCHQNISNPFAKFVKFCQNCQTPLAECLLIKGEQWPWTKF